MSQDELNTGRDNFFFLFLSTGEAEDRLFYFIIFCPAAHFPYSIWGSVNCLLKTEKKEYFIATERKLIPEQENASMQSNHIFITHYLYFPVPSPSIC